jgi:hypothetical protein
MATEVGKHERAEKSKGKSATTATAAVGNTKREVYYAPEYAAEVLEPFIRNFKTVWDPAAGNADNYPLKDYLENHAHRVVTTDILMGKDYDFFVYKTKKRYEIIVTTPPYSLRKEFVLRALDLKKPFALLVPINVLESKTIRELFKQNGVSILLPGKNVNFASPDDSRSIKNIPFCVWVLYGIPNVPGIVYR